MRSATTILARTREGRESLLETIEQYGGFSNPTSDDPIMQARLTAKRQVATDIIQTLLTEDVKSFTLMLQEREIRIEANRAKEKNDD